MKDKQERMQELVRRLKETSYAYYVLDDPVISDMQWDALYDELKQLEAETGIVLPDSPTRKVGGDPLKSFEEHRHISRLWSMDKDGRVIYLNTFSKSLSPSMRMGYMILPARLLARYDGILGRFSCTVPLLEQYALAEFLDDGSFERHLNRRRKKLTDTRGA